MDPSLGARLRAHREQQQVALSAISGDTKIKLSILEGLERDDVSQWPAGLFRRAYVRAYARAIGLDPEPLVREFLEVHPEPVATPVEPQTELENPQWPAGFRRLVTSALAAVPSRRLRIEAGAPDPVADEAHLVRPEPVSPKPEASVPEPNPHVDAPKPPELSLPAAAELCTRLGRIVDRREAAPILEDSVAALDAVGLIVWSWDARAAALRPSFGCGYADTTLARMPRVDPEDDNAIAATFQSAQACVVNSSDEATGAVVVPLMAHSGCVGVLAIELRHGGEKRESVRAFAAILAAQLVTLVGAAPLAEAVSA